MDITTETLDQVPIEQDMFDKDMMVDEETDREIMNAVLTDNNLNDMWDMETEQTPGQPLESFRQVSVSSGGSNSAATTPSPTPEECPLPSTTDFPRAHTPTPVLTGRPGIPLYLSCNPDFLSDYQCMVRKSVELFEATEVDVGSRIKGRNKPIVLGQVGIRCCYCAHVYPVESRERGAMYFPKSLVGIYQAAQILSQGHLMDACSKVPPQTRQELMRLKKEGKQSFATAGKEYWARTAQALSVYEDQHGLRFENRLGIYRNFTFSHD